MRKVIPANPTEADMSVLLRADGQALFTMNFRKGDPMAAYLALRKWCSVNNLNFSDIINSIIVPLNYFCQNFSRVEKDDSVIVTMNFGDLTIEQIYHLRPNRPAKVPRKKTRADRSTAHIIRLA